MREILYVRYNNTRSRSFQTKVQIVKDDGDIVAEKYPLTDEAKGHIDNIVHAYNRYGDIYNRIKMAESYRKGVAVCSRYINGESLMDIIGKDLENDDELLKSLKKYLDIIFDINKKYITEFVYTPEFEKIFGNIVGIEEYNGKAVRVCNLDMLFNNYIYDGNNIYDIDYEWIVSTIVPVDFMKYRTVKMFYINYCHELINRYSLQEFLKKNGFSDRDIIIFEQMDEGFQQYVHDKDRRAIYTDRYHKKVTTLEGLEHHIAEQNLEIQRLTKTASKLHDAIVMNDELNAVINNQNLVIADLKETADVLRREIRNPFYAAYRLLRKIAYKILPHYAIRALQILRNEGIYTCIYKIKQHNNQRSTYEEWIVRLEKEEAEQNKGIEFNYRPLISVIIPTYNVEKGLLTECIESVVNQTYDNWQLCIADDCSTMPEVRKVLERYEKNPKIDIVYREENGHISRATNSAIDLAKGEFIALLDCDDVLSPNALFEMVKALNENPELDYIYSDEDKIDDDGRNRHMPHFKPDWSPDTLMGNMYTCHLSLYRKSIVDEIGGLRTGYEGSQDYDLALRFTEKIPPSHIKHISKILYHWRTRKESTAADVSAKPYIMQAAYKAKEDAVARRGLKAKIELIKDIWQYRVNYIPQGSHKVSIVIPSKDNPKILNTCIASICDKTKYKNYEIIVIDNGSSDENKAEYNEICNSNGCMYYYEQMEFNFSKMCNIGASVSNGEYILFLNDDIEVINGEWLERMLGQAELLHAGAVGAKLLYPESENIQHTGVINIENGPSHAFEGLNDRDIYYFGRNKLDYNYIAVTAACLMLSKEKFNEVGGFNENLNVAYNDVDLCFKLVEAGYYNVVRTDVILYHYESYSRGNDIADRKKFERLVEERNRLYDIHPRFAVGENMDPFYNRHLAQTSADFSYNYGKVSEKYAECRIRKLDDYNETDSIVYSIDNIILLESRLCISGWAYLKGSRLNNVKNVKILIVSPDSEAAELSTVKIYRADAGMNMPQRRLFMIGFSCIANVKDIPVNISEARIAVAIGKKYMFLD